METQPTLLPKEQVKRIGTLVIAGLLLWLGLK